MNKTSPVFGVPTVRPLRGFPMGKIRLRLRNNDFAKAYVKTENGIRGFYIEERDGEWWASHEFAANRRTT